MIKHELASLLVEAGRRAQDAGDLPAISIADPPVERSSQPGRGDYASSLAMRLARAAGMPPLQIAQRLVRHLPPDPAVARVDVAAPGFINFGLDLGWLQGQVDEIVRAGPEYGRVDLGRGQSVQVEFVSANPTGVLNAANGRAGALGDALANLLDFAGYRVQREYYVNDAGSRMQAFYATVMARYRQAFGRPAEVPSDGYHGRDLIQFAEEIKAEYGDRFLRDDPEATEEIGEIAIRKVIAAAKADLELLGVRYDNWFHEQTLYEHFAVEKAIELLRQRGHIAEREGAVWFTSTELGDERDHVLIRSNGTPTYLAGDIPYHYDKFVRRDFDRVIDIWGADHHGHVAALRAGVQAMGIEPSRLTILLHQMVTIKRGDEIVRMSRRAGDFVALRDLLEEVKPDACRYFFLAKSANAHIDFDLELAKKESDENPVYYVQYGHARTASILRRALERDVGLDPRRGEVARLVEEPELALIRKLMQLPEVVEAAAAALEPHHLPHYTRDLAGVFSQFYESCRVLSQDEPLTLARLKLVLATKTVLANCLRLMGMSAPERMERAD
jgi:arginyl-tRNA synthetase